MYGYVYLTTNNINGKLYIGQHKSDVFEESYKGSVRALKEAINKYGKENFSVEVLCICDSLEELNDMERYYVEKHNAVKSRDYYNLTAGGGNPPPLFGNKHLLGHRHSKETIEKMKKSHTGLTFTMSEQGRQNISEHHSPMNGENNPMYGKHHSEYSKKLIGDKASERNLGKVWVTDDVNDRFVTKIDAIDYLKNGYRYGRKYHKRHNKK